MAVEGSEWCSLKGREEPTLVTAEVTHWLAQSSTDHLGTFPSQLLHATPQEEGVEATAEVIAGSWRRSWGVPPGPVRPAGAHFLMRGGKGGHEAERVRAELARALDADLPPAGSSFRRGEGMAGHNRRVALCSEHASALASSLPCGEAAGDLASLLASPALLDSSLYASLSASVSSRADTLRARLSVLAVLPREKAPQLGINPKCPALNRTLPPPTEQPSACALARARAFPELAVESPGARPGSITIRLRLVPPQSEAVLAEVHQPLPWHVRALASRATLRVSKGSAPRPLSPKETEISQPGLHRGTGHLSASVLLGGKPNASLAELTLPFEPALLHADELPPDHGRGLPLPAAAVRVAPGDGDGFIDNLHRCAPSALSLSPQPLAIKRAEGRRLTGSDYLRAQNGVRLVFPRCVPDGGRRVPRHTHRVSARTPEASGSGPGHEVQRADHRVGSRGCPHNNLPLPPWCPPQPLALFLGANGARGKGKSDPSQSIRGDYSITFASVNQTHTHTHAHTKKRVE